MPTFPVSVVQSADADGASAVPTIDIGQLQADAGPDDGAVAKRIGHACRQIGFFAITGHGVPDDVIRDTFDAARRFFATPVAAKQALARSTLGHNRGYVGVGVEALDGAETDRKEAFNLVWTDGQDRPPNVWPDVPGFQPAVQRCFDSLLAVGRRLHRAFALDLGLPADHFADKIDRPMATLRLLRYPARVDGDDDDALGAGAHTDYGNLTLLATDGVAGLQLRRRDDGRWIDAPCEPGALLCNIGDCLMRWTDEVYVSTPHRVRAPRAERQSIAMFLDPNPDAVVEAIASCVPAGARPRHPPISAADYLQQRFAATYGGAK